MVMPFESVYMELESVAGCVICRLALTDFAHMTLRYWIAYDI